MTPFVPFATARSSARPESSRTNGRCQTLQAPGRFGPRQDSAVAVAREHHDVTRGWAIDNAARSSGFHAIDHSGVACANPEPAGAIHVKRPDVLFFRIEERFGR